MALIFVLLAVLAGVAIADAVVENTGTGAVTLAHHSFNQLTEGQMLAAAAGVGLLLAVFLWLAATGSRSARLRRREQRAARRDMDGRIHELERENASLQDQLAARNDELAKRTAEQRETDLRDRELARERELDRQREATATTGTTSTRTRLLAAPSQRVRRDTAGGPDEPAMPIEDDASWIDDNPPRS